MNLLLGDDGDAVHINGLADVSSYLPLILVLAAVIVGRSTESGSLTNRVSDSIFLMTLTIWSYLETFQGINLLRRAMGVAGFFIVGARLIGEL